MRFYTHRPGQASSFLTRAIAWADRRFLSVVGIRVGSSVPVRAYLINHDLIRVVRSRADRSYGTTRIPNDSRQVDVGRLFQYRLAVGVTLEEDVGTSCRGCGIRSSCRRRSGVDPL